MQDPALYAALSAYPCVGAIRTLGLLAWIGRGGMKGGEYLDPTPLLKWIARHPEVIENWKTETAGPHASAVRAFHRASVGGRMSFCACDELCVLLGVHMSEVFGEVYWTARCNDIQSERVRLQRYHVDAEYRERRLAQSRERKRRKTQERRELREAA